MDPPKQDNPGIAMIFGRACCTQLASSAIFGSVDHTGRVRKGGSAGQPWSEETDFPIPRWRLQNLVRSPKSISGSENAKIWKVVILARSVQLGQLGTGKF